MQEKHEGAAHGPLDLRVWIRLLSCVTQMEKRIRRRFVDEFNTTLPRFDVMASLDRYPEGQTMGDLSRSLLVSKGNVTAVVRQLEAQNLIFSTVDPEDRRSAIVSLTEEGQRFFDEMAAAHHGWIQELMAEFSRTRQRELFDLLADLKASIAKS